MYDVDSRYVGGFLVTRMSLHDILLVLRAGEAASSFFALLRMVVFGRIDTFSSERLPLCSRYCFHAYFYIRYTDSEERIPAND